MFDGLKGGETIADRGDARALKGPRLTSPETSRTPDSLRFCAQSPLKYHLIFSESRVAKLIALVWLLAFAVGFSVFYVPSPPHLLPEANGAEDYSAASLSRYPSAPTRDTPPKHWQSFSSNSSLLYRVLRQPVADDPFAQNSSALSSPRPNFEYFLASAHNASVGTGRGWATRTTRAPTAKRPRKATQSPTPIEAREELEEPLVSDSGWLHNYCLMCTNKVYDSMYAVFVLLIICSLLLTFIYSAIFYRIRKLQTMQEATVRYVSSLRSPEVIVSAEKENIKPRGSDKRRPERVSFPQGIKLPAIRNRSLDDTHGRGSSCKFAEIPRLKADANQSPNGSDTAFGSRSSLKGKCPNMRAGSATDPAVGSKPTDEPNGTIVVSRRADSRYYSRRYRRGLATTLLLLVVFLVCFLPYFLFELCFALLFHHGTFDDMYNSGDAEQNSIDFLNVYTRLIFYFYDLLVTHTSTYFQ